jgi:tripartite-type tricarboxylate transporter receptor subunit TctC
LRHIAADAGPDGRRGSAGVKFAARSQRSFAPLIEGVHVSKFFPVVTRMLALGLVLAGSAAAQQDYPNRPIRFITPYPPGGGTTVIARLFGQKLSESWGQQVLVDNRGGGNTIIGTEAGAKSAPDGYTILLVDNTLPALPHLYKTLPYDTFKDLAPVATLTSIEFVLIVHPSVPANNLQELIALAKAKPGQLNYASSGSGNVNHLEIELFSMTAGIKMQHVPYKGGGPALTDLLGGQVQAHFNVPINLIPHIKSGKVKAIAISGKARSPALPDVPTFAEGGLPNFEVKYWQGIVVPAGTPKPIIDKLSNEIAKILATPDTREKLDSQGVQPFVSTPEQFAALIKSVSAKYAKVIETANIKVE